MGSSTQIRLQHTFEIDNKFHCISNSLLAVAIWCKSNSFPSIFGVPLTNARLQSEPVAVRREREREFSSLILLVVYHTLADIMMNARTPIRDYMEWISIDSTNWFESNHKIEPKSQQDK